MTDYPFSDEVILNERVRNNSIDWSRIDEPERGGEDDEDIFEDDLDDDDFAGGFEENEL